MSTAYHASYFAHELTKRAGSGSIERLAASLADAQVDLNPHQVEAALFALQSPLSKGAILADEVGLGKTIEAGILLAQMWAERKRSLLVIVPANLRKQWSQELAEKFYLPSVILENRSFNEAIRDRNLNPFSQNSVVICSYQFARSKEPYVSQLSWELVVLDEAHRLRNVYKNNSRIALSIKASVAPFRKVLLTATPLQNSLLELYGLVSIVDDFLFGDLKSFRSQYARLADNDQFGELKERLRPICKRTLRKQVSAYVRFTERKAIVQEFFPTDEEQRLYELVSGYLQKPTLYALPASQRMLMTLILCKLLAPSTYAISGTLDGLADKLQEAAKRSEAVQSLPESLPENFEEIEELADEWAEDEEEEAGATRVEEKPYSAAELEEVRKEISLLRDFASLAKSILRNSKGEVLLKALRLGFAASEDAQMRGGASRLHQKAIIFTESRRTQEYLYQLLEGTEFAGRVLLFNGSNTDARSKEIYQNWLARHRGTDLLTGSPTADKRAALIDCFREEVSIMVATEAAAEGINLQFCNLVVNFDLPWNPQRIEQRIGRCHRYGQKFDVVVVNFLNKKNAADQRVYQLLDEKFKLFHGVFGASDEVLGTIGSGIDFERRIAEIYQRCRTEEQIEFEFTRLQGDLEGEIDEKRRQAREQLLNNFDREVVEKVRIQCNEYLAQYEDWLWQLTRYFLRDHAEFTDDGHSFFLRDNPFPGESIHPGPYRMGKQVEDVNTFRVGHPLAQRIIEQCRKLRPESRMVRFDLTNSRRRIAVLEGIRGRTGWLSVSSLKLSALEEEEHLLLAGVTDSGDALDADQCRRFFFLPGMDAEEGDLSVPDDLRQHLHLALEREQTVLAEEMSTRHANAFDAEMDKLDRWAEDRRNGLKAALDDLDSQIKETRKEARLAPNLPEKLKLQRELKNLESKRDEAWRSFDEAARQIEKQKDTLLDEISQRLH